MDDDAIAAFLVDSELQLARDAAEALGARMWTTELERGEFLFHRGDPSDRLFVVYTGELAVQTSSMEGRELVFTSLKPGAPIGEVSAFDRVRRTASVRAVRRSRVLAIGADTFLDLLHVHPSLSAGIARYLAASVRRLSGNVERASFLSLRARLADLLVELAEERPRSGGSGHADLHWEVVATQQELADRLGSSRESVNKLLARWVESGAVALRRGRVEILDRDVLIRAAREEQPG